MIDFHADMGNLYLEVSRHDWRSSAMFPTSQKGLAKYFDGPNCDVGNVAVLGRILVADD